MRRMWLTALAITAAFAVVAVGCGNSSSSSSGGSSDLKGKGGKPMAKLGKGEGQVNLVNWAGYVESGQTDPKVDWVHPFEKQTGCKVTSKVAGTSDEMVTLMRTGQYDGVSASGDATLRLIAGGDVAPVNTSLVPNYKDVFTGLKNQPYNSVEGQMYGIPHGRGANLLMFNTQKVTPKPTSWDVVFDPKQMAKYKGHLTAYDSPIYIADAAVYLKAHRPDLKITNPYELDDKQFNAAIDLLKQQRKYIGEYWSDYTKEQSAFANGNSLAGTSWQITANLLKADKEKVSTVLPSEGSTGWSDTWMISSHAKHPNCMYQWMNYIISPKPNAEVAEFFGEAPANRKSCKLTSDPNHCTVFHAADEGFFKKLSFWTTPRTQCGDSRGNTCKDYSQWTQAWTQVKG